MNQNNNATVDKTGSTNRLNSMTGMALAYWAYPHEDVEEASKIAPYPEGWRHATIGQELPIAVHDANGKLIEGFEADWNIQRNASGKIENQFEVSINDKTHEITIDFKGSDALSNWKSDLGNSGASEFAQIQAKAQAALDYFRNQPDFKDYTFATTGHSLGGGMAQSFALKNNLDAYVYNSLPIARDTINGGYYDSVGGYEAAIEQYKASGRTVHDVRTPNDIATYWYDGMLLQQYLSERTGQGHDMLPGGAIPDLLKTVMIASGEGTLVVGTLMGKDHTMGSMFMTAAGLGLNAQGRFERPDGHTLYPEVPYDARRRFAELSRSPVTEVQQDLRSDPGDPQHFHLKRADGSRQSIQVWPDGQVNIDHRGSDGQRVRVELNQRKGGPATFTEMDAQGNPISVREVAMRNPSPEHMQAFVKASEHLEAPLREKGWSGPQIAQLCAATVAECSRRGQTAEADRFLLSADGQRLGVLNANGSLIAEVDRLEALTKSTAEHLGNATSARTDEPTGPALEARQGSSQNEPTLTMA